MTPADVGLPYTLRRRVPGLRREEVAELLGISADWYRWFESGRPIRVSTPFLARLARVLHLGPYEERRLYHLSLPELYQADEALAATFPRDTLLTPIESPAEIDSVARALERARERFLAEGTTVGRVRPGSSILGDAAASSERTRRKPRSLRC